MYRIALEVVNGKADSPMPSRSIPLNSYIGAIEKGGRWQSQPCSLTSKSSAITVKKLTVGGNIVEC